LLLLHKKSHERLFSIFPNEDETFVAFLFIIGTRPKNAKRPLSLLFFLITASCLRDSGWQYYKIYFFLSSDI